jgi:(1->4)-alpha-D-glucan 1-alpha-D-glucosylmutase
MMNLPSSTYRFQFSAKFTFKQALELVDYLHDLGISHIYASPFLEAKKGSLHGYDIVDPRKINPEVGTQEELESLVKALQKKGMGLIIDIVPNHMSVVSSKNHWWQDVLENGPSSPYADYYDIDWNPPRPELKNKVLFPVLEEQFGTALENQVIQVIYQDGAFLLELPHSRLPTDPKSWNLILAPALLEKVDALPELKSISTAIEHLPPTTDLLQEKVEERLREKEVIKKRLRALTEENSSIAKLLQKRLLAFNGLKGEPRSFEEVEKFINAQPYRLSYWRVANDEVNYRRFFDIFAYAGIRTEKPEVFEEIHTRIFDFVKKGWVEGIRVDHVDGLWDPENYLVQLAARCPNPFYLIVEKILIGNEKLPSKWPLDGTVGYDFLNQLNALFVVQSNKDAMVRIYRNFTGISESVLKLIFRCKSLILTVSMSSELHVLSRHLDRVAQQHRYSRDFTAESLRFALRDVIASFPVYRSYFHQPQEKVEGSDRQAILSAVSRAKRFNPASDISIFDFIQSVLLLEHPPGLGAEEKKERKNFLMRFQQLTGPVMAKGLEDTAFYCFYPLSSLNEVGYDLHTFGESIDVFHQKNLERVTSWPRSMTTTTTHDTKRGEDVRARMNVLSEMPEEWQKALNLWSDLNKSHRTQEGDEIIPDANTEYLFYQTLIGTWPIEVDRMKGYLEKALKEAKVHTSWINPNPSYDQGVQKFIEKVLHEDGNNLFLKDFTAFLPKIVSAGFFNSLSQVVLKFTSPGIPDIYQGNEIEDFSLVDPDNRRAVDYSIRQSLLSSPKKNLKLDFTTKILHLRKEHPKLFLEGSYLPLVVEGDKKEHIIAFARVHENKALVVISTRFFLDLLDEKELQIDPQKWKGTKIKLPPELQGRKLVNIFDKKSYSAALEETFNPLPFAVYYA